MLKTALDNAATTAKMGIQVEYVVKQVDEINKKMDTLPNSYVPVKEYFDFKTTYEDRHRRLENKIDTLQKYMWMGLGALAVFSLIIKFFLRI